MEYLQVFDKDKHMLNEKVDRDNKYNLPNGKYFMISLVFIENDEKKFLFQRTSPKRHSCIATTGGHVSYGDNGLITAIKEVKEELGLIFNEKELEYVDTVIYKNCLLETFYIKKNIDIDSVVLQKEEVDFVEWYSVDEIYNFIDNNEFRDGNIKPFKKVLEYIEK